MSGGAHTFADSVTPGPLANKNERRHLRIPGGDRTRGLRIRSPTRFPLRYRDEPHKLSLTPKHMHTRCSPRAPRCALHAPATSRGREECHMTGRTVVTLGQLPAPGRGLSKIAVADCVSSPPGGVLVKVFN